MHSHSVLSVALLVGLCACSWEWSDGRPVADGGEASVDAAVDAGADAPRDAVAEATVDAALDASPDTALEGGSHDGGTPENVFVFQAGAFPTPAYEGAEDTYISTNSPTQARGGEDLLVVGAEELALLRFDVSAIPTDREVESVTLRLYAADTGDPLKVLEATRAWTEQGANWWEYAVGNSWQTPGAQGEGDRGSAVLVAIYPSGVEYQVLSFYPEGVELVQTWVRDPSSNVGLMIGLFDAEAVDANSAAFTASDSPETVARPRLTVVLKER